MTQRALLTVALMLGVGLALGAFVRTARAHRPPPMPDAPRLADDDVTAADPAAEPADDGLLHASQAQSALEELAGVSYPRQRGPAAAPRVSVTVPPPSMFVTPTPEQLDSEAQAALEQLSGVSSEDAVRPSAEARAAPYAATDGFEFEPGLPQTQAERDFLAGLGARLGRTVRGIFR